MDQVLTMKMIKKLFLKSSQYIFALTLLLITVNVLSEEVLTTTETATEATVETSKESSTEISTETTAEKLENLKSEVLAVNRDLFILEEDLLFPASTQVAVYLSVDIGYFFSLDNVKLTIDGKTVTHHLYTEKDVSSLYRGAIQKLYMGNINTGEHQLVAVLIGVGPHNRNYKRAVSVTFNKGTDSKALEIKIRDDEGKLQPTLSVVEW